MYVSGYDSNRGEAGFADWEVGIKMDGLNPSRTDIIEDLMDRVAAGRMGRRTFLIQLARLGVSSSVAASLLAACSSTSQTSTSPSVQASEGETTSSLMVRVGKQYAGKTVNFQVEAGLQAAVWKLYIPKWNQLTGTTVNLQEVNFLDQFPKAVAAHEAGTKLDALYVAYSWLPDLVGGGVLEDFGPYIKKYFTSATLKQELADIAPAATLVNGTWNGKQYGFPIDAPGFTLHYRSDIFSDSSMQAAFKQKYGYDLAAPTTWDQYDQIGQFITSKLAPSVYGGAHEGQAGSAYFWFCQMYNNSDFGNSNYFDDNMNATVNGDAGVRTLKKLNTFFKWYPPGSQTWGAVETWGGFLKGNLAMVITWTPLGRLSAKYGATEPLLNFVPVSQVVGKWSAALPPGGNVEEASGYSVAVYSSSDVKDLAFAFLAWATSQDVYLDLVSQPIAVVKPIRISEFTSPKSLSLYPNAQQYYSVMGEEVKHLTMEPKILSAAEYLTKLDQAITATYAGGDAKQNLDKAASAWNDITARVGKDKQKAAYAQFQQQVAQLRTS